MQVVLAFALLFFASIAAEAHSLKALEEELAQREPAAHFNANEGEPFPDFALKDARDQTKTIQEFQDKVVLLDFLGTAGVTDRQVAAFLATLQKDIAVGHMTDAVAFISIFRDDGQGDAASLLSFGKRQNLDPVNWTPLSSADSAKIDDLAKKLGARAKSDGESAARDDTIYVIDREGHLRARFRGHAFDPVNLVLYANALVNDVHRRKAVVQTPPTLWRRIKAWF